jgi:hypothetical protein
MYQDLLAIDITDPRHVQITGKVPSLFERRFYVNGFYTNTDAQVVTGWTSKDTTVTISEGTPWVFTRGGIRYYTTPGGPFVGTAYSQDAASGSTGTAGSMASMVLINDYLYAIAESHSLGIVSVANAPSPSLTSHVQAGFDLETIYPFGNLLFLGSKEGVYMYDVTSPTQPVNKGVFTHGRACDPVIADGSYAYVTLHAGTSCGGASNELDIVSLTNMQEQQVVHTYPLTKPTGLCKDGNLLFVCDDAAGVKVFDAKDPANLQLLTSTGNGQSFDVIASNNHLLVVANAGLYQYDYTDPSHLRLLSLLPAK